MQAVGTRSTAIQRWRKIAIGVLVAVVIGGLFYPPLGLIAAAMMVTLLILSLFRGRYWCGNLCPRGAFLDILVRRMSPGRRFPAWARSLWLRASVLVLLMSGFAWSLANLPVGNADEFVGGVYGMVGAVFVRLCLITTLGAIFLAIVSQHRAWCAVCPMGTMQNIIDRAATKATSRARIATNPDECRDCGVCETACPMDIPIRQHMETGEIDHPDCLRCGECVDACPTTALSRRVVEEATEGSESLGSDDEV
ncbi:MAG: 4Fe-4S binding protein [Armatimonadota bacterium]